MAADSMEGYPDGLLLSPLDWPDLHATPHPGDLKQFVTQSVGLDVLPSITPYGELADRSSGGSDMPMAHSFLNAPLTEPNGGTLYFDDHISELSMSAALQAMGVESTADYVAYAASSSNPPEERYLDQLRIVSINALISLFEVRRFQPPKQSLNVTDAFAAFFAAFIVAQKEKWADGQYVFSSKMRGTAGGDGDWTKESLAFGIHVENTYWGIYRIWSRPWLVTK